MKAITQNLFIEMWPRHRTR